MFTSPNAVFFNIGNFPIYYYGVCMALALCVGVFTSVWIAKRENFSPDIVYDISPFVILGGILGARLYYCALNWGYYCKYPTEILQIWQGGISIHGAILGGLVAGAIYAKIHKLSILKLCDIFSYGLILAQAVGRWGNFFNSEAFGRPTDLPWKLFIPLNARPAEFIDINYFHPTFLYESIWNVFVFLILYFIIRKLIKKYAPKVEGLVFCAYLILYSIGRILIEGLRIDSVLNLFSIPIAQIVSVLIILLALLFGGILLKKQK